MKKNETNARSKSAEKTNETSKSNSGHNNQANANVNPKGEEKSTTTGKENSKSKEKITENNKTEEKKSGNSTEKTGAKGKTGKATGKTTGKKPVKDPYENLKKEDLVQRIKTYEEQIKMEKEEKKKAIENKNKEIESKEKVIFSIAGTNRKLVNELEDLKREVDDKLEKVGLKQIQDTEKEKERKKKQTPLEQILKVKEKELKNAMNLIEILKKDRDNLERDLNEKGSMEQFLAIQDQLREEEAKNEKLELEIKILNKLKDEHNKCTDNKGQFEKEKIQLINDLKYLKDKNKELKEKIRAEEEKAMKAEKAENNKDNKPKVGIANTGISSNLSINNSNKINPSLTDNKNKNSLPNINTNNPSKPKTTQNKETINSSNDLKKYWRMLDGVDIKKEKRTDSSPAKDSLSPKEYKKYLSSERQKFALSLQSKNFKQFLEGDSNEVQHKLLGPEEKQILSKLLPPKQIAKLERKFELVDQSKQTLERKYIVDTKSLQKKINDIEGRLEMAALNLKECEQRNKILHFQISQHKNENKMLSKRIIDLNANIMQAKTNIKEKDEENKKLVLQIGEVQKKVDDAINNPLTDPEEENEEPEEEGEDEEEEGEVDEDEDEN